MKINEQTLANSNIEANSYKNILPLLTHFINVTLLSEPIPLIKSYSCLFVLIAYLLALIHNSKYLLTVYHIVLKVKLCASHKLVIRTIIVVHIGSFTGIIFVHLSLTLVENARKFRESAPNQILIFGEPPPRVGVSENVWFFKAKRVYRAGGDQN